MGIKGLWTLLGPFCERKPLYEIRGETVAVDLSGWVCDSQNVADYAVQPRLYLRNLYFRTSYLLLGGITPVFVLEGEAPALKQDVMAARNLLQFRGGAPKTSKNDTKKPDTKRKRFSAVLTQCEKLLSSMGLQCVKGYGEAEAMCAHLNATGAVSAVISQDSDCFAYGAKKVYRNFSVSNASCNSANSGSVDVYDLDRINLSLDVGRQKMIALALLCGCDYNGSGIDGVGYSNAVSFIMQHSEKTIIDRLVSWTSDPAMFQELSCKVEDPTSCTGCGHGGNVRSHARSGCHRCKTDKGCDQTTYRDWRLHIRTELSIRSKSLSGDKAFPDPIVMDEFLTHKEETPKDFNPRWRRPDLIKFVKLMSKSLTWTESYCIEKFLPLLTRWQLLCAAGKRSCDLSLEGDVLNDQLSLEPDFIKKKRTPKGVACYEVVWKDPSGHYSGLVSDDQIESVEDLQNLWTTVERQDLMDMAYPDIVKVFLESKTKKSKKKEKTKETADVDGNGTTKKKTKLKKPALEIEKMLDINESMKNLSIEIVKQKETSKTKKKPTKRKGDQLEVSFKTKPKKNTKLKEKGQKKMDAFVYKGEVKANEQSDVESIPQNIQLIRSSVKSVHQSPLLARKKHLLVNLDSTADLINNLSLDGDESDDAENISYIIDGILERKNCVDVQKILQCRSPLNCENVQNFSTPVKNNSGKRLSTMFHERFRRVSYFFGDLEADNDAFEQSMDLKNVSDDNEKTIEYVYKVSDADEELKSANHGSGMSVDKKKDNILSLEERLFGKCSLEVMNNVSPIKNNFTIDSPVVYTPLAERIRKLKRQL